MKNKLWWYLGVVFIFCFSVNSSAITINLYVDSAPNVYGSPNWAPWWTQTKQDVVTGTFINMRTGTYPGTTTISPYDEIVYSTMDLGKRLHWIYWLPGQTKASLGSNFQVKWVIDWAGTNWTYDWSTYSWALDSPTSGWVTPSSWEDYSYGGQFGVIGSFGFAWWAGDNEAPPYDTDGNPWNETDQADIDALAALVLANQTFAKGMVRYWNGTNYETSDLQSGVVPEPSTLLLLGSGLLSLGAFARFQRRKKK